MIWDGIHIWKGFVIRFSFSGGLSVVELETTIYRFQVSSYLTSRPSCSLSVIPDFPGKWKRKALLDYFTAMRIALE